MLHNDSIISDQTPVADIFIAHFSTIADDVDKSNIITDEEDTILSFGERHSEHLSVSVGLGFIFTHVYRWKLAQYTNHRLKTPTSKLSKVSRSKH